MKPVKPFSTRRLPLSRWWPVLTGAVLLAGSPAGASEPATAPLTLSRAVVLALGQEPGAQAASARRDVAAAEAALAETARRPSLTLSTTATRYQEPRVVTPIHGFTAGESPEFEDFLIQAGVTASYDLYVGGAREARIEESRFLATAAEADLGDREQAVILSTATSYLEILGLAEVLEAHQARLAALTVEQDRVEQMLAAGRAAEVDLRRIEAATAAAVAERVRLETTLDVAERDLARLLGLDEAATRAPRLREVRWAPVPPVPREELTARALAANPQVVRARAELAAADAAVGLAASGRRPRLRLEGGWVDFGSSEGDFTAEWQVGLRLAFPLFDGGATRRRVVAATAARAAAAAQKRLAEQRVEGALDRALARLEESRARVGSLETAVQRFAEVSRIEKLRLETGVGTPTDFLDAEAELLETRAGLVRARLGRVAAYLEVARVLGDLDAQWVATHLEEAS